MAANNNQQNSAMSLQLGEKPPLANHDSSVLDLAFAMDVTGSMGSYIHAAQQSIRNIVEEIVSAEKSDIRMALVEYRDHPPQDSSFVTRTHDFTDSIKTMKDWLDNSQASGGGDAPEAVADAMHDVLKLSWRPEATKICILIADAPPHGLIVRHDGFPQGCPNGLDPVVIINQMAEKNITVYSVGCEPAINECRDFFMALAHITGGQYVPLGNAKLLAKVIIGGAQEEITLQRLMEDVHEEVVHEMQDCGGMDLLDEDILVEQVHKKLAAKGAKTKALLRNDAKLEPASDFAQTMAGTGGSMADWKKEWETAKPSHTDMRSSGVPMMAACAIGGGAPMGGYGAMRRGRIEADGGGIEEDCYDMADYCMLMSSRSSSFASDPLAPSAVAKESYSVVDTDLDIDQARRMVKKSIAMNKVIFKK